MNWQNLYLALFKPFTLPLWKVLLFILGGVTLGLLIDFVKMKISHHRLSKENLVNTSHSISIVEWLTTITQKPDPLGNLLKYETLAQKGEIKEKNGPRIIHNFFEEIKRRGNFESIGSIGEIIPFDKAIHISLGKTQRGDLVQVIMVGWRYRDTVIKKAAVQRVK